MRTRALAFEWLVSTSCSGGREKTSFEGVFPSPWTLRGARSAVAFCSRVQTQNWRGQYQQVAGTQKSKWVVFFVWTRHLDFAPPPKQKKGRSRKCTHKSKTRVRAQVGGVQCLITAVCEAPPHPPSSRVCTGSCACVRKKQCFCDSDYFVGQKVQQGA